MHIKFIRAGRSGQKAVAYLLKKREAEEVIVRRGQPVFFADLVDSLEYTNPYSSAVIAFAPEDRPTEEQIEEVIEKFQQTAWAGLEDDDFCILAVEHRRKDGKGTHLHFLIANYHIGRKKHYNPAPPGWQKRYDLLRDYFNLKYGWARPDDEKRARKVQPGYLAFPGVAAEKRQVLAWAEAMAEMGLGVREIAEIAQASGAEIVRSGNDYVTLAWGKQRVRVRIGKKEKKEVAETIEEQRKKWQKALEKLAKENRERYGDRDRQKGGKEHGGARERITGTGHCVRGVQTRRRADPGPESGPGGVVVLPSAAWVDVGRGPGRRIPRRMQRLGSARIRRVTRGENSHGVRIRWAPAKDDGTNGNRDRTVEAPAGGARGHDAASHGGARRAAPGAGGAAQTAGRPESGMGELWQALEGLLRRLGNALVAANSAIYKAAYRLGRALGSAVAAAYRLGSSLERTTASAGRTYEAVYRLVTAGGVLRPARGAEPMGAEQVRQPPAARREEPKADVPKRDWPRQGWPPGRQGPGLG